MFCYRTPFTSSWDAMEGKGVSWATWGDGRKERRIKQGAKGGKTAMSRISIFPQPREGRKHICYVHPMSSSPEQGLTDSYCRNNQVDKNKALSDVGKSNFSKITYFSAVMNTASEIACFSWKDLRLNWKTGLRALGPWPLAVSTVHSREKGNCHVLTPIVFLSMKHVCSNKSSLPGSKVIMGQKLGYYFYFFLQFTYKIYIMTSLAYILLFFIGLFCF